MKNKTTLYKKGKKNTVLVWEIEWDDKSYWTTSGQEGGKMTTTAPTFVEQKNVGKANETSLQEQVLSEVNSKINKQYDNGYTNTPGGEDKFEVSLANKYHDRLDKDKLEFPYIYQPKLDGIRCYIKLGDDNKLHMYSRKHKEFVSCPHIIEDEKLLAVFNAHPDLILDGELYNHVLKDEFGKICSIIAKKKITAEDKQMAEKYIRFNCFDCLFVDQPDLIFSERNNSVANMLTVFKPEYVDIVSSVGITAPCLASNETVDMEDGVESLIEDYIRQGFEGIMLKKDVPYLNGRSNHLLKYKRFKDAEYEIITFEEGKGNLAGYATTVVCKDSNGTEFRAGVTGDRDYCKSLFDNRDMYLGCIATIKYQELTPVTDNGGGVPRFGKMTAIRDYE